jgi:hypothetical protein
VDNLLQCRITPRLGAQESRNLQGLTAESASQAPLSLPRYRRAAEAARLRPFLTIVIA